MIAKIRYQCGYVNYVTAAVNMETAIEIGDLLWQDIHNAKPASEISKPDNEGRVGIDIPFWISMEKLFVEKFLGVAMQRSRSGDTYPIQVATTGVFEFDVLAGECFELGDLIGLSVFTEAGLTDALQNQQVSKVKETKYAIGRAAKREPTPVTSVLVDIRSTVMTGGILGSSPSGG